MIKLALQHYLADFGLSVLFDRISRNFIDQVLSPSVNMNGNILQFTIDRVVGNKIQRSLFKIYEFPPDMNPDIFTAELCDNAEFTYMDDTEILILIQIKYGFMCTLDVEYI